MKKGFKVVASVASIAVIASAFVGCGGGGKKSTDGNSFTYWCARDGSIPTYVKSYNDMLYYQKLEEATGKKITFQHPAEGSEGAEAFTTTLASGKDNLPDMMEYHWQNYPGGPEKAITDGAIVRLNDYINEDCAKYFWELMEGETGKAADYEYKKQTVTDEGSYFGFPNLNVGKYRCFQGLFVRGDVIESWGMEVPKTIADWDALLAKAKAEGFEIPFSSQNIFDYAGSNTFNTAYNVAKGYYIDDNGKIQFAPMQPGFKEYIAKIAEWYGKGYIDVDYPTVTSDVVKDNFVNGKTIASWGYVGGTIGGILPAASSKGLEGFKLLACPLPVMNEGDTVVYGDIANRSAGPYIAITSNCGNVEEAAKWCDFIYGEEGEEYHTFGEEGNTYTKTVDADGVAHYEYTDKIRVQSEYEKYGAKSVSDALYTYMRPANGPGISQHKDYLYGYYPYTEQIEALEMWNANNDVAVKHSIPNLYYTTEESEINADYNASIEAEINTELNKFIRGEKSMDEFDSTIKALWDKGFKKLTEIKQAAYDRYLKR